MGKNINVMLPGNTIKAAAGEKKDIGILFDEPVFASIYERGSVKGWQNVIKTQERVNVLSVNVEIHDDTTHYMIVTNADYPARLDDKEHITEAAIVVEVTDKPQPEPTPTPTPTPTPEPDEKDLGAYKYKYGLLGDIHICEDNDDHTPGNTNDDWWDEADFKAAMDILKDDPDVKFVECVGDVIESGSPKKATPEDDFKVFFDLYNVPYWQIAGLRFFTPTGNHDNYGMYESRWGDKIFGDRFTDETSVSGYNNSVNLRIGALAIGGQGINGIVPGRGRVVFDTDDGKTHTSGQGDMQFFAFNGYIEMYKDAAGYAPPLAPTENRFSDEAIKCMTDYVLNHWSECKDNLTSWKNGYVGMRNAYSKLSYWMRKGNDIFINLSLDYGDDKWGLNDSWHDRMIHARTIIDLDDRDPYVKRMKEYVADTQYSSADEPYNYRYYSPNALIWLKEIIENNKDKKIHVFMHHYLPHRVGNDDPIGDNLPKNGGWSYAYINPAGVKTADGLNAGSNAITGITFWFLSKLFNENRNVVCFSGHSHISYENSYHADNRDYPVVMPSAGNAFVYTKDSMTPKEGDGAWMVSVPSLSKPRLVERGSESRLGEDAEMSIVEVYDNGIKLKGYKIKKNNKDVFNQDKPLFEKIIILK